MSEILKFEAVDNLPSYTIRIHLTNEGRGILLLHGLSGDEKSMWSLGPAIPKVSLLLAPRGIYQSPIGGYSWTSAAAHYPPMMKDFQPAVEALIDLVRHVERNVNPRISSWILMGFSQGAACAFAMAASDRLAEIEPVEGLAVIAGFLPEGNVENLRDLPIYWGHGLRDEHVPVVLSRKGVEKLRREDIEVDYCETDVGHKLGSECLQGFKQWYEDLNAIEHSPGS